MKKYNIKIYYLGTHFFLFYALSKDFRRNIMRGSIGRGQNSRKMKQNYRLVGVMNSEQGILLTRLI